MFKNKSLFSFVFASFPILNIYAITGLPGLSIGQFILVFLILRMIIKNNIPIRILFKNYIIYSLITTICSLVIYNNNINDAIYEIAAFTLFFIIINFSIIGTEYQIVKKWVINIGIFALLFFILQYLLFAVGHPISGIIDFLPLSNNVDTEVFRNQQLGRDRLSSIFQEPAHYSEFMAIVLTLLLINSKVLSSKNFYLSIIISITIILCKSTTGAVLLFFIWCSWGLKYFKTSKYRFIFTFFITIFLLYSFPLILSSSYSDYIITRFDEISFDPSASINGYSSYIRVLRGYIPIFESDYWSKIFGHGLGSLPSYIEQNPTSLFLKITDFNRTWVNSFQYILFMTGFIGAILFSKQIISFFKCTTFLGKVLIIQYISSFFSSSILLTPFSALYLYFIVKEKELNHDNLKL